MTINRRDVVLATASALAAAGVFAVEGAGAGSGATGETARRERVLGIGGFFFRSPDPKKLAEWYQRHLGVDPIPTDYGHSPWQQAAGITAFGPFPADTDYFGPKTQAWLLNFRVRNLDAMVAQLRADGIAVDVDTQSYPNGRFARTHDPDGNPLELWEPAPLKPA